jgi:hypothetical protein
MDPVPLTGLRERSLQWTLERARADGRSDPAADVRSEEARFEMVPEGHLLPYFDDLLTDAVGRIWLRSYRLPWEGDAPQVWNVFEADGRSIARIELPGSLRVMHLGKDHVTGVVRDELEVEYVVVYRIEEAS